eukprot:6978036-Prymnesium_polylepis.1
MLITAVTSAKSTPRETPNSASPALVCGPLALPFLPFFLPPPGSPPSSSPSADCATTPSAP